MDIKLIVFDLAGTTIKDNFDVHRVLQYTLASHNVIISIEEANTVMGIPKPVAIRALLLKKYDHTVPIADEWIDAIHKQFVGEMVRFYETSSTVGEKEGVTDTFARLRSMGIKVAIDTGFNRTITTSILKRMNWMGNQLIDCSVTSDEVPRGRPYPDMIFEAMKQTGVFNAGKVVKVGDTASDMQQGKAAGCGMTVAITSGAFSRALLEREQPSHLIENIPDVMKLIC